MLEKGLRILLDQNIPFAVAAWFCSQRPSWRIWHVKDLGFEGRSDDFLYRWAQQEKAIEPIEPIAKVTLTLRQAQGERCNMLIFRSW